MQLPSSAYPSSHIHYPVCDPYCGRLCLYQKHSLVLRCVGKFGAQAETQVLLGWGHTFGDYWMYLGDKHESNTG